MIRSNVAMTTTLLAVSILALGCASGGADRVVAPPPPPPPPPATASLSGTITDLETGNAVAGATVAIGNASGVTSAIGRFELSAAPVGTGAVSVTAAGFDAVSRSISIQSGANILNVALPRINTMYEADGFLVYIPTGVTSVRGIVFPVLGGSIDSRPLIRGEIEFYQGLPLAGDVTGYRQRMVALARSQNLALMGKQFPGIDVNPKIIEALASLSTTSGHAELANSTVLLHGHSNGACTSYAFAVLHPERVIGFIPTKGICPSLDGAPAAGVPGYFIFGQTDPVDPAAAADMTTVYLQQRTRGAVWAIAAEPNTGHEQVADLPLLFDWMEAVITRRLPSSIPPGPVELRPADLTSGWLGNQTSMVIARYACYTGDKLTASWLPSEQAARDWQAMVSRRSVTTVIEC